MYLELSQLYTLTLLNNNIFFNTYIPAAIFKIPGMHISLLTTLTYIYIKQAFTKAYPHLQESKRKTNVCIKI